MPNRDEKASPTHPSINPFKLEPLFRKSLQFCPNVSVRFREDKAPSLSLLCYVPSHRYLLCLCLTDYYTPQCQIFSLPAKVFVNNTPFLHSEKEKNYSVYSYEARFQSQTFWWLFAELLQMFQLPFSSRAIRERWGWETEGRESINWFNAG